ncbi:MAG: GDSL-type esterase/lipase family protein [Kiritimatiellales bacterium]|jgi:lysophospholipase L1-like esterase|nr:GDSL-type esterase/lipase family protein [Kiritimatiellales bacterium]
MKRRRFISAVASFLFLCMVAASVAEPVRVACVGDSITAGAGVENRDQNSYPAQLGRLLGEEYNVVNFGVSGATLLRTGDYPYWSTPLFVPAHKFNPDIVVIKLGTNDSKPKNWQDKDHFVADYVDLIKSFRDVNRKVVVYICYPAPAFSDRFSISGEVVKDEICPMIDEIAKETNVEIIDLYTPFLNKSALFPDGIHPNQDGAKLLAETVSVAVMGSK